MSRHYTSKTIATWLALTLGGLGLHRWYTRGWRDFVGWLHPIPTLLGIWGLSRMQALGQDDQLAWLLIPLLGLSLASAMLNGIIMGLTPDERWNATHNAQGRQHHSGWGVICGVVLCLMLGAGILMSTIAFSGQRYFESQLEATPETTTPKRKPP